MSRINLGLGEKDQDQLLSSNRLKLKKIFAKHLPNREGKITTQEFLKLCQNMKILQDLITLIDLKRLISQLSIKQTLSYAEFENAIKTIAQQSFNNSTQLADKIRMLLIHVRNPCKMHYQVSLNLRVMKFGENETSQEPAERHFEIKPSAKSAIKRHYSISPMLDNNSQSRQRIYSLNREKPKQKSISPCFSIDILDNILQRKESLMKIVGSTAAPGKVYKAVSRTDSISPFRSTSQLSSDKVRSIKGFISSFATSFTSTLLTPPKPSVSTKIQAQLDYISTIRRNTFEAQFIKRLIFNSWRTLVNSRISRFNLNN